MKTHFSDDWKNWIATNIAQGQSKDGLFRILLDEGFSYETISHELQYTPSRDIREIANPLRTGGPAPARPDLPLFIPNAAKLDSPKLELYTLTPLLNARECDYLVKLIRSRLRPSTLSSPEDDTAFRTSQTCDLGALNDPMVEDIDRRLCQLLGIDPSYSEPIQGQYYEVGQEFKAHTDYFEAHELAKHGGAMGQRTYTIMVYLNTVEAGGETEFRHVGTAFAPREGQALIWNSLDENGSPNHNSLHQAHPVRQGYKAVITKWFRCGSRQNPAPPCWVREANENVRNYTRVGFNLARIPEALQQPLQAYYHENAAKAQAERVSGDFVYTEQGTQTASVLIDLSDNLRRLVHQQMQPILEQWAGCKLEPTFVYGIREYRNGAILTPHRDRLDTHIISAILNIDQDVDEDWPLQIDDNTYRRYKVLLKPGEMVFYESCRLLHGRPTPLKGRRFASVFCHFRPK